ncbi:cell division protein ZapD [Aliikangiella marina]|uniref:Cell division protein ZapD n=1 Tax=Aliikangiella marina TaxID=1712262 RepID=A0A545T2D4_9GAMM|nr:cell division protein ZapD [Aliikangiella marina]TQV71378.1 cell division protein ZapD [Aliikangiella marina]
MTDNNLTSKSEFLLYEYPLKENVRGFLRLETLFKHYSRNVKASNGESHLHALKIFFEILEILERGDTRSELIKELARLQDQFSILSKSPDVDLSKLENFLKQIKQLHAWVLNYEGKFGDKIRKDPFIEAVKYRSSIPGGACSFDCPDLFLFLNAPLEERVTQFNSWLEEIKGVKTSIDVILRIIRESGHWTNESAPLGSFMIETTETPLQLLRLKLDAQSKIFPDFSCGRHRSNIHFMVFNEQHRKTPIQRPIAFQLACCQ